MKKYLLILTLLLLPALAHAAVINGVVINGVNYTLYDGYGKTAEVMAGSVPYSGNINIPNQVIYNGNSYHVNSININAFNYCSLKQLTIEDGTELLHFNTNASSTINFKIESLYLGRDLKYESEYSPFRDKSTLTSVTIGNNVTSIGMNAFDGCSALTSATIGNSVTSISSYAFNGCNNLHLKIFATTPPKIYANSIPLSTPVEVPLRCGCIYAKSDKWRDIKTIYTLSNTKRLFPVPISVFGESILSVNGQTNIGEGLEMEEGELVNLKGLEGLINKGMVLKDISDITNTLICDRNYSFPVSASHCKNRIDTYTYTNTIQLTESGTLINHIEVGNIDKIETLKVKGEVNGTDILTIRKMTNLKCLDLGEATIVGGGMSYYENYTTSFNVIGDYFFKDKTNLASVILPAHITSIKQRAFQGMTNLRSIIIPASVTEIGDYAFLNCVGLDIIHFDIAGTALKIGYHALYDCHIKSLYYGRPITDETFRSNKHLTSVIIGNGMISIPNNCFKDCYNLSSIMIPMSITSIGKNAFEGCVSLSEVHISDVKSWCEINFADATSNPCYYSHSVLLNEKEIEDLTFPLNVNTINAYSFINCNHLKSLTIHNRISSIGTSAFSGCSGLVSATIGNSIHSIGNSIFEGCSSLRKLTIEDGTNTLTLSNTRISNSFTSCPIESLYLGRDISYNNEYSPPFSNKASLKSIAIGNNVTSINDDLFSGCTGLISVTIGNGVKAIGNNSFRDCNYIKSINIPNSVTSIGHDAFYGCSKLESIHISDLKAWCKIIFGKKNGTSYSGSATDNPLYYAHHLILNGQVVKDLVIPSSIDRINHYAFCGCTDLISVTIPENVKDIDALTPFLFCDNIENISLFCSIVPACFQNHKKIKKIVLGDQIINIGEAFSGCTAVTEVHSLNPIPPVIVEKTFASDAYDNSTLYVPTGCTSIYWLHPYWEKFAHIKEEYNPTGINYLPEDSPHTFQENDNIDIVFTLDGRCIQQDKSKLPHGIYIINGKKVYIK